MKHSSIMLACHRPMNLKIHHHGCSRWPCTLLQEVTGTILFVGRLLFSFFYDNDKWLTQHWKVRKVRKQTNGRI